MGNTDRTDENKRISDVTERLDADIESLTVMRAIDVNKAYARVTGKLGLRRKRLFGVMQRVAAVLMLPLLAATIYMAVSHRTPEPVINELRTGDGMTGRVELPDGSVVILNAHSTLRYPSEFTASERTVWLDGEAYMQIHKDPAHPMEVMLPDGGKIHVYGTTFNVDAYSGGPGCVATLVEGSIGYSFTDGDGNLREYRLRPDQTLTHNTGDDGVEIVSADISMETAWKDNIIILDNTPLSKILRILEKKYDVRFAVEDETLNDCTFSGGSISLKSLDYILSSLRLSSGIEWTYRHDSGTADADEKPEIMISRAKDK